MSGVMDGGLYKELVRKAIGARTQKRFAEIAEVSPFSITRLLNTPDNEVPVPRRDTIRKIANASEGRVTEDQLLYACGFKVGEAPIRERAMELHTESEFYALAMKTAATLCEQINKMAGSAMKYDSIKTFIETAALSTGIKRLWVNLDEETEYAGSGVMNSECLTHCSCIWYCGPYKCTFYLSLFNCKTQKDGVIVSGAVFDLSTLSELDHGGARLYRFHLMEKGNVDCGDYPIAMDFQYSLDGKEAIERLARMVMGEDFDTLVENDRQNRAENNEAENESDN